MAVSKSVPHRVHELSHGVAELLVPFFLAEIGLHFDLKVFEDPRVVVLAALLLPVAVISKSCSDAVWARVPKLDWRSERSAPIRTR